MARLRLALCQLDPTVGDLEGNTAAIIDAYRAAEAAGAHLAAFGELAVCGYPPEDLLLKPGFVADARSALGRIAAATGRCAAVVGFPEARRDLFNAAAVCAQGQVLGTYRKRLLPNNTVFDEARYFTPGTEPLQLYSVNGVRVGVTVCEDAWSPTGPIAALAAGGAEVIVNINASPYHRGKAAERERMLATRAADASCAIVYVNQVGGQDELVFDGASMVFDHDGSLLARAPQFVDGVWLVDLDVRPVFRKRLLDPRDRSATAPLPEVSVLVDTGTQPVVAGSTPPVLGITPHLDDVAEVYAALVCGTRDYVRKNGFSDVVLGLSGGIDSALVACIAADALGPDRVHTVAMPSRYSSEGSITDAEALAANLGCDHRTIPIEPAHAALMGMLEPSIGANPAGLTEENLQSRIRGVLLMALSNATGWLVVTTGNKSELATGYSTLYGDSAGGYALIKDVPKTEVYRLCAYVNARAGREVIPEAIIRKPPSAELRPGQRDDQSLPPYDELDPLLEAYVEHDRTVGELVEAAIAAGVDPDVVRRVTRLVDLAEYKRRQNPPGVRVTPKAFGKDRRLPITNRYRG
jgi:NAD+ synthase (glutamine-hydrolysing)